jgi:hypothetical protein
MVQAFAPRTTSSTEALGLEYMIDGKHCTECGHLKWWSICSNQKWYLKCLFTSKKSFEIFCDQKPVNLKELKWCLREASKRPRYRHSYTVSLLILDTRIHHFFLTYHQHGMPIVLEATNFAVLQWTFKTVSFIPTRKQVIISTAMQIQHQLQHPSILNQCKRESHIASQSKSVMRRKSWLKEHSFPARHKSMIQTQTFR